MRTIILLAMLMLVSCGGSITPTPPNNGVMLVTSRAVMDGGLGSTISASIDGDELCVICDARSGKTIHFWATIPMYDGEGNKIGEYALDYTGNYNEEYIRISPDTRGLWIDDWGMRE